MSERKGAIILIGIIATAALGFSGYLFLRNEILATSPESGLTLVGLWDEFTVNKEFVPDTSDGFWRIEFNDNQFNNSNHISVSNNNTSFKLLKEGFYKITLLVLLNGLDDSTEYWVYLMRNGSYDHCFDRVSIPGNPGSAFHQVESSLYVKSTGLDNFYIRCYSFGDILFGISSSQYFNQLSIEYNQ
jgi:hypothetical protein